jgi:hypothetical protein
MQMPCPLGGRASILCVMGANGECVLFSLLSHSTMTWLTICNSRLLEPIGEKKERSPLMMITFLVFSVYLVAGWIWQIFFSGKQGALPWFLLPILVISAPVLAFYRIRSRMIMQRLTGLQEAVVLS